MPAHSKPVLERSKQAINKIVVQYRKSKRLQPKIVLRDVGDIEDWCRHRRSIGKPTVYWQDAANIRSDYWVELATAEQDCMAAEDEAANVRRVSAQVALDLAAAASADDAQVAVDHVRKLEKREQEDTTTETTTALAAFAAEVVPVSKDPHPSGQWKTCVDGTPNCGLRHDRMSIERGKFCDGFDELTAEMNQNKEEFDTTKRNINEELTVISDEKTKHMEDEELTVSVANTNSSINTDTEDMNDEPLSSPLIELPEDSDRMSTEQGKFRGGFDELTAERNQNKEKFDTTNWNINEELTVISDEKTNLLANFHFQHSTLTQRK